jgi:hypothetical protein
MDDTVSSSSESNKSSQFDSEQNSPERDSKQNDSYIKNIQGSDQTAEDINTRRPKDGSDKN